MAGLMADRLATMAEAVAGGGRQAAAPIAKAAPIELEVAIAQPPQALTSVRAVLPRLGPPTFPV